MKTSRKPTAEGELGPDQNFSNPASPGLEAETSMVPIHHLTPSRSPPVPTKGEAPALH